MVLETLLLLLAAAPEGEVRLPLRDYVALVDAAQRNARRPVPEPTVAQLVRHETRLRFGTDGRIDFEVVAEAEMRGSALQPVAVALPGPAARATVAPAGLALLGHAGETPLLVPLQAGRATLQAEGETELDASASTLVLPATKAAAVRVVLDLPGDMDWVAPPAVAVDDASVSGRRRVVLTVPSAQPSRLEIRARAKATEAGRLLARAVAVTLLDVRRDEVRRHDVLVHEVQRGEIRAFEARVPAGLQPDVVATDEGVAAPTIDGARYAVPRQKRLTGTGYLGLSSRLALPEHGAVPLPPVEPAVPVRARYLAVASRRVAEVRPLPADGWTRVDVADLPGVVRQDAEALGLFAVWRERPSREADAVQIDMPGPAPLVAAPIRSRTTTTVVTREGRVLDRERLVVDVGAEAVELPIGDAEFWSASLDGEPVIPAATQGTVRIPLAGEEGIDTEVEIVSVRSQAVPEEGELALRLGAPAVPVLEHAWRVVLPDGARYRVRAARGLRVVPVAEVVEDSTERAILAEPPGSVTRGEGGDASIRGIVVDPEGAVIPGATLKAVPRRGGPTVMLAAGANGRFLITNLPDGPYDVTCEMPGFASARAGARLQSGRTSLVTCRMRVAAMEETIDVVAEAPSVPSTEREAASTQALAAGVIGGKVGRNFADMLDLKQGLVGGVRPVPVTVPEQGKLLRLSGVMPGPEIALELEVKKPR